METETDKTIWKTNQFQNNTIEAFRQNTLKPNRGNYHPQIRRVPPRKPNPPLKNKPFPVSDNMTLLNQPHSTGTPLPKAPLPDVKARFMNKKEPKPLLSNVPLDNYRSEQQYILPINSGLKDILHETEKNTGITVSSTAPHKTKFQNKRQPKAVMSDNTLDTLHVSNPPYVDRHSFMPKLPEGNVVLEDSETTEETKFYDKHDPIIPPKEEEMKNPNPFVDEIKQAIPSTYITEDDNLKERLYNLIYGVDYDNFNFAQFRLLVYKIFNFFPEATDIIFYAISSRIVNMFYSKEEVLAEKMAKKNNYEEDKHTLKMQMYSYSAIPFSFLVAYNVWYLFTTVYPYKKIGEIIDSNAIVKYIFETTFAPTVVLNYMLFGYRQNSGKSFSESIYNTLKPGLCIVAVLFFLFIYKMVNGQSAYVRNTFNYVINNSSDKENALYSMYFFAVMVSFVGINIFFMKDTIPMISMALTFMNPITSIVSLLVKMIVVLLTVPIGMLLLLLYIVIFATFGIMIYNGVGNLFSTMKLIDIDIKSTLSDYANICEDEGIFHKAFRLVNAHIYDYLGIILFVMVLAGNYGDVSKSIHSKNLKVFLIGLYSIMACAFLAYSVWKLVKV